MITFMAETTTSLALITCFLLVRVLASGHGFLQVPISCTLQLTRNLLRRHRCSARASFLSPLELLLPLSSGMNTLALFSFMDRLKKAWHRSDASCGYSNAGLDASCPNDKTLPYARCDFEGLRHSRQRNYLNRRRVVLVVRWARRPCHSFSSWFTVIQAFPTSSANPCKAACKCIEDKP